MLSISQNEQLTQLESKMVQPLRKTARPLLIKLQTHLLTTQQFQSWVLMQEMKTCPHTEPHRNAPCGTIHNTPNRKPKRPSAGDGHWAPQLFKVDK